MGDSVLHRLLDFLANIELVVGLLWGGLAVLTIVLLVLTRTRWGQSRPLRKCVVLSILAHLLFIGYATTVQIVAGRAPADDPAIHVTFIESNQNAAGAQEPVAEKKPWEQFVHDRVPQPDLVQVDRQQPEPRPEPRRQFERAPLELPSDASLNHLAVSTADRPEPKPAPIEGTTGRASPADASQKIDAPAAQRRDAEPLSIPAEQTPRRQAAAVVSQPTPQRAAPVEGIPTALLEQPVPLPQLATLVTTPDPAASLAGLIDELHQPTRSRPAEATVEEIDKHPLLTGFPKAGEDSARRTRSSKDRSTLAGLRHQHDLEMEGETLPGEATVVAPASRRREVESSMPSMYSLRDAPNRLRLAEPRGATPETEAAVAAALKWLAENQWRDGRWDASDHGAGRELLVAGRNRYKAGTEADTGITALALLAMLASGHTHKKGLYNENVRRGLEYLLRAQARDGNLGGHATPYAKMYCHSMATFALSEAYGMTGDYRLRRPLRRALNYTLSAQNPSGGGWRYKPGDPGDTSQAGWQLMALKSADLAGIQIPVETRNGLIRYLRSAAGGKHGGLSSYRPNEGVSRPMTAEALACWQFLGMPREHPASNEAGDYLLGELPGVSEKPNFYYYYYATLGMYQLGGVHWERWNDALKKTLIEAQQKTGPLVGSWDPDSVWGGYGGRVYATALAALSLEVYYRFLPLYAEAAPNEDRAE